MRTRKLVGIVLAAVLVVALGGVVAFAATRGGRSGAEGWQMMGGRYEYKSPASTPVRTLSAARSDAQQLAGRLGLRVDEVMQFERNFYAKLVDSHGHGATEVLVDPASGDVSIEYGPAMMWNTRYGMGAAGASMMGSYGAGMTRGYGMAGARSDRGAGPGTIMGGSTYGGMMGGSSATGATTPTMSPASGAVSLAGAHRLAQRWLDSNEPSVKIETGGDAFPGYYTLETLKNDRITGMISVNARTGAVFPHWWHGAFIAKSL